MFNIEYINYVGQHPLTSSHPHYQSIYNNPPKDYGFSSNPVAHNPRFDAFCNELRESRPGQDTEHFIQRIHDGAKRCPNTELGLAPTLPYIGPENNLLVLEDWSDTFTFLMGCHTAFVDFNAPYFGIMAEYMSRPNFKGIITHMKDTIQSFDRIMHGAINNKLHYVPIGFPTAKDPKTPKKLGQKLRVLVTNSYGAPVGNFYVRGGVEAVVAVTDLINDGHNVELTVLGPTPRDMIARCNKNTRVFDSFVDEAFLKSIIDETDVFLIPAMRVHSISVVRAMCEGIVPIVSDGWGFDEFVIHGFNGLVCKGHYGHTTMKRDEIFVENYDAPFNKDSVIQDIKENILFLLDNPKELTEMSKNAKHLASINHDIEIRNKRLGEIFDEAASRVF